MGREKNNLEKTDMSKSSKLSRENILQTTWSPEPPSLYCKHIDSMNNKKCKRMSFRKGSYCYKHKDLYDIS
jgi:hypothetical protein